LIWHNYYAEILEILEGTYKDSRSALVYGSVWQLLVAVMLSAQTNDNQVNKITEDLFFLYPEPEDIAALSREELESRIRTCGLYKNKAKNILATARIVAGQYGSLVPKEREQLQALPGVGRKTANVVLSVGYGLPALAVDTHVFRLAHRLGLSQGKNPEAVEKDLCRIIPKEKWGQAHHWLIWHGRKICQAQKPKCEICPLLGLCQGRRTEDGGQRKVERGKKSKDRS